jgi:hypothetical protein
MNEAVSADAVPRRPMGIVAGLVNKRDQPAGDIVREIVQEAYEALNSASGFLRPASKL